MLWTKFMHIPLFCNHKTKTEYCYVPSTKCYCETSVNETILKSLITEQCKYKCATSTKCDCLNLGQDCGNGLTIDWQTWSLETNTYYQLSETSPRILRNAFLTIHVCWKGHTQDYRLGAEFNQRVTTSEVANNEATHMDYAILQHIPGSWLGKRSLHVTSFLGETLGWPVHKPPLPILCNNRQAVVDQLLLLYMTQKTRLKNTSPP